MCLCGARGLPVRTLGTLSLFKRQLHFGTTNLSNSGGTQTRFRTVTTASSGSGTPCGALTESQNCTGPNCGTSSLTHLNIVLNPVQRSIVYSHSGRCGQVALRSVALARLYETTIRFVFSSPKVSFCRVATGPLYLNPWAPAHVHPSLSLPLVTQASHALCNKIVQFLFGQNGVLVATRVDPVILPEHALLLQTVLTVVIHVRLS